MLLILKAMSYKLNVCRK